MSPGNSRAAQQVQLLDKLGCDVHRVGASPLRDGDGDRGYAGQLAVLALGEMPGALFRRLAIDNDCCDIAHVNRAPIAGGQKKQPNVRDALECLTGYNRDSVTLIPDLAGEKRPVC